MLFRGPEYEINYPPETWVWLAIEKAVEQSGMEWTHIRPSAVTGSMFEGNYPATGSGWQESILKEGMIREPYLQTGYYPFIHEDDLAGVAFAALLEDKYLGMILEAVNIPIRTMERIQWISKAIDREILTEELTPEQAREHWRNQDWPDETIAALRKKQVSCLVIDAIQESTIVTEVWKLFDMLRLLSEETQVKLVFTGTDMSELSVRAAQRCMIQIAI